MATQLHRVHPATHANPVNPALIHARAVAGDLAEARGRL
jgi:hypothetical protein